MLISLNRIILMNVRHRLANFSKKGLKISTETDVRDIQVLYNKGTLETERTNLFENTRKYTVVYIRRLY